MKTVEQVLAELIRIPSTSCLSNKPVVEYAKRALETAGWTCSLDCYRDRGDVEKFNLIAAPAGQSADDVEVELAFLCHTDTVPPAADWARALEPFVEDGILYGCGACDVKGFLACLLKAALETSKQMVRAGIRIVLTADEEIGCLGSHRLVAEERLRLSTLVVGEPTSLHAARAGKGYCLGEMIVRGAEAHSAHPDRGRSAIYGAARVIQAIEQLAQALEQRANPFFDPAYTTINVGTIRGGTAKNIVAGECRFLVEWRPIPGVSSQDVAERVEQMVWEQKVADPALDAEFKVVREQQGFETAANAEIVRTMERLTGRETVAIPFGSEASVFGSLADEIVVFGPGDMRTAHSARECVAVSELDEAVRCVKALMLGL